MSDILIIGGGFAGVWSAMAATRLGRQHHRNLTVTLVAPNDDLVIRPRLYQADPATMRVPLARVLHPIGVRRLAATATIIDQIRNTVVVCDTDGQTHDVPYRRLILASGSALTCPRLPGSEHLYNVDTMASAVRLDTHLGSLPSRPAGSGRFTAVVIGAGFTGLEVATELVGRLRGLAGPAATEVRVILVEQADVLGPELGDGPRSAIASALGELGVEVRLNASVASVSATTVRITAATERAGSGVGATSVDAHTAIWTAGVTASHLTRQIPGRHDRLGRLYVDEHLRVAACPSVFVAGDTAAADTGSGQLTQQSCQHAIPLGRTAGYNASADLLGCPLLAFAPEPYATCLDLGAAGAVFTTGWERTVQQTGEPAKEIKRAINEIRIYPPLDDEAAILLAGDPRRTWAQMP